MTVRVGVIGAGAIGSDHIRRLRSVTAGAEVAVVTDIDADRAAAAAERAGARVAADGAALIAADDVDAVLVTSWAPTHAEHVLAAIAADKPVLCEKPLATEADDALRIVRAEAAHRRRLVQVGFMRRYDPGYRELKRTLDAGTLGAPLLVHCAHRNVAAAETYQSEMAARETAVHEVDALRWLLGEEIASAQVLTPRPTRHRYPHLRDPQLMLFATPSGVRIDLEVFVNCRYGYDIACEVVAEDGLARLPGPAAVEVRHAGTRTTAVAQGWQERFAAAFDAEFRAWIDSVAAGTGPTGPTAWDGYAAAVVTDAAVTSMRTGDVTGIALAERPDGY